MTDEELKVIEERVGAATPGPWYSIAGAKCPSTATLWIEAEFHYMDNGDDAIFIAAARSDVPALCAEVRRLRVLVKQLFDIAKQPVAGLSFKSIDQREQVLGEARVVIDGG